MADPINENAQAPLSAKPSAQNSAPVFTSPANATVHEKHVGIAYVARAADPDGDIVTLSLEPVGDSAMFAFEASTGRLSFVKSPLHDQPWDTNADNVYSLVFQASDGQLTSQHSVAIGVVALNNGPELTSAQDVTVPENSAGVIYTLTAEDEDGDPLAYNMAAERDADVFNFDPATQELSFLAPPDFERPEDDGADNIYDLRFEITDGVATRDWHVTITVTNVDQNFVVRSVAQNLRLPIYVDGLPDGSGRIIVLEKFGRIRIVDPDTGAINPVDFLDIQDDISANGERGVLGLAFSPDFENDGTFYINASNLDGDSEIRRYTTFAGALDLADPASKDVILTYSQTRASHIGGWLGFDENGYLLATTGDGADLNTSQDDTSLSGKVLRLDVTGDDYPDDDLRDYRIPPGNMFGIGTANRPEIFAKGLRNPFRASFDPLTGDLLIADVGGNQREEVSRLPIDDPYRNFGWPLVEGTAPLRGMQGPGLTPPVTEYSHGEGDREGQSIIGGYVYQGPVEALQDHYIFGDFVNTHFWAVPVETLVDDQTLSSDDYIILTDDFTPEAGEYGLLSSFGTDASGNLYITSYFGNEVFRFEAE